MEQTEYLTRFTHAEDPVSLSEYTRIGGFTALERARGESGSAVCEKVTASGLRGRGGAGFPTGKKWSSIPRKGPAPYVVCNADEGEPGTFKDRFLMERAPYLVIEGIAIAAHAIGAGEAYIYIRGEYASVMTTIEAALDRAADAGCVDREPGGPVGLTISVKKGGGSYVVGDETALLNSLMGNRGYPMLKPPYPTERGLWNSPTVVNNVETLACLPLIVAHGAEWFAGIGARTSPGPKLYCVSGHVNAPGVYEFPMGVTIGEVIDAAGGIRGEPKAVQIGGTAGPFYGPSVWGRALDYDSMTEAGGTLGSGAVVVMNTSVSMLHVLEVTARFFSEESCGQCFACRYGTRQIEYMANRIATGRARLEYLDLIRDTVSVMDASALCPFGQAVKYPIGTLLDHFSEELTTGVKQQQYVREVM